MKLFLKLLIVTALGWLELSSAATLVYVHGRISSDGDVLPEGQGEPYDPMLLDDTGSKGLSTFKMAVESDGHSISSVRDINLTLNDAFLVDIDVLIFGLHQKLWSSNEKQALDRWLRSGGGMLIYSDSASGGAFNRVGAQNLVGQSVTNNLIGAYGMEVTVDQADGTTAHTAQTGASISAIAGRVLEGEGVSPVAIAASNPLVEVLIPYERAVTKRQGLTITDPLFAALALRPVAEGHVVVMFDRQPMWNNGPGSDIGQRDNALVLRAIVNFLAPRSGLPNNPGAATSLEAVHFLLLDGTP